MPRFLLRIVLITLLISNGFCWVAKDVTDLLSQHGSEIKAAGPNNMHMGYRFAKWATDKALDFANKADQDSQRKYAELAFLALSQGLGFGGLSKKQASPVEQANGLEIARTIGLLAANTFSDATFTNADTKVNTHLQVIKSQYLQGRQKAKEWVRKYFDQIRYNFYLQIPSERWGAITITDLFSPVDLLTPPLIYNHAEILDFIQADHIDFRMQYKGERLLEIALGMGNNRMSNIAFALCQQIGANTANALETGIFQAENRLIDLRSIHIPRLTPESINFRIASQRQVTNPGSLSSHPTEKLSIDGVSILKFPYIAMIGGWDVNTINQLIPAYTQGDLRFLQYSEALGEIMIQTGLRSATDIISFFDQNHIYIDWNNMIKNTFYKLLETKNWQSLNNLLDPTLITKTDQLALDKTPLGFLNLTFDWSQHPNMVSLQSTQRQAVLAAKTEMFKDALHNKRVNTLRAIFTLNSPTALQYLQPSQHELIDTFKELIRIDKFKETFDFLKDNNLLHIIDNQLGLTLFYEILASMKYNLLILLPANNLITIENALDEALRRKLLGAVNIMMNSAGLVTKTVAAKAIEKAIKQGHLTFSDLVERKDLELVDIALSFNECTPPTADELNQLLLKLLEDNKDDKVEFLIKSFTKHKVSQHKKHFLTMEQLNVLLQKASIKQSSALTAIQAYYTYRKNTLVKDPLIYLMMF